MSPLRCLGPRRFGGGKSGVYDRTAVISRGLAARPHPRPTIPDSDAAGGVPVGRLARGQGGHARHRPPRGRLPSASPAGSLQPRTGRPPVGRQPGSHLARSCGIASPCPCRPRPSPERWRSWPLAPASACAPYGKVPTEEEVTGWAHVRPPPQRSEVPSWSGPAAFDKRSSLARRAFADRPYRIRRTTERSGPNGGCRRPGSCRWRRRPRSAGWRSSASA